jgi:hypothetical protein
MGAAMSKISLNVLREAREGMTLGKYVIVRRQNKIMVEINDRPFQIAMMASDAPTADPAGRNALGFAMMTNHFYALLEIAEAALEAREPITDEATARARYQAELRLDAALAKVTR